MAWMYWRRYREGVIFARFTAMWKSPWTGLIVAGLICFVVLPIAVAVFIRLPLLVMFATLAWAAFMVIWLLVKNRSQGRAGDDAA